MSGFFPYRGLDIPFLNQTTKTFPRTVDKQTIGDPESGAVHIGSVKSPTALYVPVCQATLSESWSRSFQKFHQIQIYALKPELGAFSNAKNGACVLYFVFMFVPIRPPWNGIKRWTLTPNAGGILTLGRYLRPRELERGKQQVYYQGQWTAHSSLQRPWKTTRLKLCNSAPGSPNMKDTKLNTKASKCVTVGPGLLLVTLRS